MQTTLQMAESEANKKLRETVNTTINLDRELQKLVKKVAIDRGVNQSDAIHDGLRLWLAKDTPSLPTDMSGREAEYVGLLLQMLRDKNLSHTEKQVLRIITGNLEIYAKHTRETP